MKEIEINYERFLIISASVSFIGHGSFDQNLFFFSVRKDAIVRHSDTILSLGNSISYLDRFTV